jgi:hypothetical protein
MPRPEFRRTPHHADTPRPDVTKPGPRRRRRVRIPSNHPVARDWRLLDWFECRLRERYPESDLAPLSAERETIVDEQPVVDADEDLRIH